MGKNIIIGSDSYIAQHLVAKFNQNKIPFIGISPLSNSLDLKLDLLNPADFNYDLIDKNDIVIFFAAISSPDRCHNHFKESFKINVIGTIKLIEESIKKGAKILFFSSDTVYGNTKDENNENVIPYQPIGEYALMKLSLENYFRGEPNFKLFRLSYVFSWHDKFMEYLHKCKLDDITAEIFHPFTRKMVYIDDVIDGIIKMIEKWDDFENQIFNFCSYKYYSRLDITYLYQQYVFPIHFKIIEPTSDFYKARPELIQINSNYSEVLLSRPFTTIEEAIKIEQLKFK